ncbi:MAG TPA: hypothetical protein PLX43_09875 [Nitrobacter sp.]|nr:hypothetical protein [Nitrobacter sp.]
MLPAINCRAAPVGDAYAARTAMKATTADVGDLNDVSIHARRWRSQGHGVRHAEGGDGGNEKGCCKY